MKTGSQLVDYISSASRMLIFTGAGISTGSGIKDFRGPQGVWKTRQPVYYQDFMSSEAARIEHLDYKLEAWESFREAKPNAVHRAIADLEKADKVLMLVELHGTNAEIECQSCGERSEAVTALSVQSALIWFSSAAIWSIMSPNAGRLPKNINSIWA